MRRGITQRDVAKLAKVSQAAVSRVMANNGYVAEEVRRKIVEAAATLGYRPDPMARSLITGRSNIVAIVVGNVVNPFFPVVLDAMTEALRRQGYEVLLFNAARGQSLDEVIPDVLHYKVAGIILTTVSLSSRAANLCDAAGVPVVMFHRYSSIGSAFAVACDSHRGGADAARLLLEAGCQRMAYIGGIPDSSPNRDRSEGFVSELARAGLRPVSVENRDFSYDWGRDATTTLLARLTDVDGIFCGDDAIAFGAVDALRHDLGMDVPGDVSVVGFDDVPQAGWAAYDLTTVRQPIDLMIAQTLTLLNVPKDREKSVFLIPGEVILRSTVGKKRLKADPFSSA